MNEKDIILAIFKSTEFEDGWNKFKKLSEKLKPLEIFMLLELIKKAYDKGYQCAQETVSEWLDPTDFAPIRSETIEE